MDIMNVINQILPIIVVSVVAAGFVKLLDILGLLSKNDKVMNTVSAIAANPMLKDIALDAMKFAQKYVSPVAMEKLQYAIQVVNDYAKKSGIEMTAEEVLQIVQNTYDENAEKIKSEQFIQKLIEIVKENDNDALKNN